MIKAIIYNSCLLLWFCAFSFMLSSPAYAVRNCINTGVPFLVNGKDSGYDVEIMLANYSDDFRYIPQFGKDKEAHWELVGKDTVRVFFHPRSCYDTSCQYYIYVGIHDARGLKDGKTCSGYNKRVSVKDYSVNFTGSFRFMYGKEINRKSFYITPAYGYADKSLKDKKVCAFNNYGGEINTPLSMASMAHSERDWWHNIYWGNWYDSDLMFPGDISTPGQWVSFREDLNNASEKAEELAVKKWRIRNTPHFKKDHVVLVQASVGAEYNAGDGWLVFDVKDLNLDIRKNHTE